MSPLDPAFMLDITYAMSGLNCRHEHTAIRCTESLEADTEHWTKLGFRVVKKTEELVFLQHETNTAWRLEIIAKIELEHQAWAVRTAKEFRKLENAFMKSGGFKPLGDCEHGPQLKYTMFVHKDSGIVIQIIWRKTQLFADVFHGTEPM